MEEDKNERKKNTPSQTLYRSDKEYEYSFITLELVGDLLSYVRRSFTLRLVTSPSDFGPVPLVPTNTVNEALGPKWYK